MFTKITYLSSKEHNPHFDIVTGYLNKDAYITYGQNTKDSTLEVFEYYSGWNYVPGSKKRSFSRSFTKNTIPKSLESKFEELKKVFRQINLSPYEVVEEALGDWAK